MNLPFRVHARRRLSTAAVLALTMLQGIAAEKPALSLLPELPPFLDVFLAPHQANTVSHAFDWNSAVGAFHGTLIRPDDSRALPALVIVTGPTTSMEFADRAALDFAQVGYATLVVPIDRPKIRANTSGQADASERTLALLTSAVRRLRGTVGIDPARIGAVGWAESGWAAMQLAAAQRLEGCILVDPILPLAPPPQVQKGLHRTAVLFLRATADASLIDSEKFARFFNGLRDQQVDCSIIKMPEVAPGFMDRDQRAHYHHARADRAWFEIYEFLGRHVEDAHVKSMLANFKQTVPATKTDWPTIAELMQAINGKAGVRAQLLQSLEPPPTTEAAWKLLRARAAVIADGARRLETLAPSVGSTANWRRHTAEFRVNAVQLYDAARQLQLEPVSAALARLKQNCGQCHLDNR